MAAHGGRLLCFAGALSAVCAAAACAPGGDARKAEVDGEKAYTLRCGYCHDVPNGIGADLTPRVLASYATVGALDRYLRTAMPHEDPGGLSAEEYDGILGYLLESRSLVPSAPDYRTLPDSTTLRVAG